MTPRKTAFSLAIAAACAAACGGTLPTTNDGGTDAGDAGGDSATSDGGACVPSPQQGAPCVPGQVTCDKVNACCVTIMTCNTTSKTWEPLGLGCACMGNPCGPQTCSGTEMCLERGSGVPQPDGGSGTTYECAPYPDACKRNWTCGCVEKNLPPSCTVSGGGCKDTSGSVTLTCMGA